MKKAIGTLSVILFLVLIGIVMFYFNYVKNKLEPKKLVAKFTFGKQGRELGEFTSPSSIAIKGDYLYVADSGNSRIQILKINPDGSLSPKFIFGKQGRELGEFTFPSSIAIKGDYLFVGEYSYIGNSRIQILKINPDGSLSPKFTFGREGASLGEFKELFSIAIKGDYLYVADSGNSRIQILKINPDGSLSPKFTFGREGAGLGEFGRFSGPFSLTGFLSIAIKGDYLYVAEYSGNSRIQILKINPAGSLSPKFTFGKQGRELGEFTSPSSLAINGDYLYVADAGNNFIQILKINSDGSLSPKFIFGRKGKEAGEFIYPFSLAIKDNHLFITDSGNNRIQVLEIKY